MYCLEVKSVFFENPDKCLPSWYMFHDKAPFPSTRVILMLNHERKVNITQSICLISHHRFFQVFVQLLIITSSLTVYPPTTPLWSQFFTLTWLSFLRSTCYLKYIMCLLFYLVFHHLPHCNGYTVMVKMYFSSHPLVSPVPYHSTWYRVGSMHKTEYLND